MSKPVYEVVINWWISHGMTSQGGHLESCHMKGLEGSNDIKHGKEGVESKLSGYIESYHLEKTK